MSSEDETVKAKEVEFYAAQVNAWLNTRFELDKSLLTLSAGGVGLLVTLTSTLGVKSVETLVLYILALISFVVCLACILWIFRRNSHHIEEASRGNTNDDTLLIYLDRIALSSFGLGVIFSSIIGVSIAIHSLLEKEKSMAENNNASQKTLRINDSVSGITAMAPTATDTRSLNGLNSMSPSSQASQTANSTPSPQTNQIKK